MLVNSIKHLLALGYSGIMTTCVRMIVLPLSNVLHYCLTKTPDLTLIGCHNVQIQSCWMVVTASMSAHHHGTTTYVCAPSRVLSHIHYINSDLRRHFLICDNVRTEI